MDYHEKLAKAVRYFVYRNITKGKDQHHYSLKSLKSGRVEKRSQNFYLKKGKFVVSDRGRQRVLDEKRKNVHAGVRGYLSRKPKEDIEWSRVSYNPKKSDAFRTGFNKTVSEAAIVKFTPDGVFVPT